MNARNKGNRRRTEHLGGGGRALQMTALLTSRPYISNLLAKKINFFGCIDM